MFDLDLNPQGYVLIVLIPHGDSALSMLPCNDRFSSFFPSPITLYLTDRNEGDLSFDVDGAVGPSRSWRFLPFIS